MHNRPRSFERLCVLLVLMTISGCALMPSKDSASRIPDFQKEIAGLEAITGNPDAPPHVRAAAHLELARLYSNYRNQGKDYLKAFREMDIYISLEPEKGETDEIQDRYSVLKKIHDTEKEKDEIIRAVDAMKKEGGEAALTIEQLKSSNKELRLAVEQLEKKNQEMKKIIEQLQSLDVQMEMKRSRIR